MDMHTRTLGGSALVGRWAVTGARAVLIGAGVAVASAGTAQADTTLDQFGTLAVVTTTECPGTCTQVDLISNLVTNPATQTAVDGDVEVLSASTLLSTTEGSASAHSTVSSGPAAIPSLGASASSNAGTAVISGAAAVQGYTYTGAGAITLDLDFLLTGSITNVSPDPDPTPGSLTSPINARLEMVIYLYRPASGFAFPDPTSTEQALALIGALEQLDEVASFEFETAAQGPLAVSDTLSIDLDGSDPDANRFYLVAGLAAGAAGDGRVANAADTLTFGFSSASPGFFADDLAAVGVVPLPGAVWLLAGGLLTLAGLRRRRSRG